MPFGRLEPFPAVDLRRPARAQAVVEFPQAGGLVRGDRPARALRADGAIDLPQVDAHFVAEPVSFARAHDRVVVVQARLEAMQADVKRVARRRLGELRPEHVGQPFP